MKIQDLKLPLTTSLSVVALGLASAGTAQAQRPHYVQTSSAATSHQSVQAMPPGAETFTLAKIAGRPLRNANGDELGTVSDFLVDAKSGAVHFAMVPSGRGQNSETFRLVPIAGLDGNNPEAFTVQLGREQWDRVGTLVEERLKGKISLDAELRQRIAQQFNLAQQAGEDASEFVRVSQLKGQPIRSHNDQLGTIEDVLIDVRHKAAAAVLTPTSTFGSTAQKFLVPFQQLQFGADGQAGITTTLTRGHFQSAQGTLSPTGYPTASTPFNQGAQQPHASGQPFNFGGQQQPVTAAAAAVQQAIARDQSAAGVQVVPESRLVLRGSVENQQKKLDIERAAVQAAPGVQIENQITVRTW